MADTVSLDTLASMIDSTRLEREQVEKDLELVLGKVDKLRNLQNQLRTEQDALEGRMSRLYPDRQSDQDEQEPQPTFPNWKAMPRTLAVETAVGEIAGTQEFAGPSEIEMLLRQRGRTDTRDEVGGALAHLNRTDKIHSVGRARWVPGPEVKEVETSG